MKKLIRISTTALSAAFLSVSAADAQSVLGGNGTWTVSTNWTPNGVPTDTTDVLIDSVNGSSTTGTQAARDVTIANSGNATTRTLTVSTAGAMNLNSLTLGGNFTGPTGSSILQINTGVTVNVTNNITMSTGAGESSINILSGGGSLNVGGGTGSINKGAGAGAAKIDIRSTAQVALGISSASVTQIILGQGTATGNFSINSGQTYTASTNVLVGNGAAGDDGTGILSMNGGTLTTGSLNLNAGNSTTLNNSVVNLNSGTISTTTISRANNGASQAFNWNGGTISNKAGGNLTVGNNANAIVISLAGTGTHTFDIESGKTATVNSTVTLQDKSGENGTLTKAGLGTLTINGAHTYTGETTINAGTLVLSGTGSVNSSSGVSVANASTFTNNSSVAFNKALALTEGAILNGTGVTGAEFAPISMTITADLSGGAFTTFALGTTGLTKAGGMGFTLTNITAGTYTVFSGSALAGNFSTMTIGVTSLGSLGGGDFSGTVGGFNYTFTDSTNVLGVTVVPEPATWALLAGGLTVVVVMRRRRRIG